MGLATGYKVSVSLPMITYGWGYWESGEG